MDNTTPTVTCVLIVFDGARFLDEAIASVVGQVGCDDWELIVVDDGSTDESTAIAQRWAASESQRIRYLDHPGHANLGMSASRNAGLSAARGRYVGFLDSDDVWLPSRVAHGLRVLAGHPDADVMIGATWRWHGWSDDPADIPLDHQMSLPAVAPDTTIRPPALFDAIYGVPGQWRVPAMCSLLVDRAALLRIGGLEAEFRGLYEDQALYTKIALHLASVIDVRPAALYRQHPESACARSVRDGIWRRDGPSQPATAFLDWMQHYVDDVTGPTSTEAAIVRRNIEHGGWLPDPPTPRLPRLRRWAPAPVRRLFHQIRDRWRPDPSSVVAAWSEQFLRPALATMGGDVLVVTGSARVPWVDDVPGTALRPNTALRRGELGVACAAGCSYDHVVVCPGAVDTTDAAAAVVHAVASLLRPGGSAAILLPAQIRPPAELAAALGDVTLVVETFGNARTARAVADGVPAVAVGVELELHDQATPVLVGVTLVSAA